ncbi:3-hydroxybutyryl-CoA dehydrogenase FadB2 [Gordonia jinhuaensis]|uniref:3-hydroxybutyryl-CoA dehydrogenase n=1 Tax=Gordonia jinhuaensis TaxID=1517702 RepID=A0A916T5W7_9ACTN|nr:3-hydroxybutyryl-CoA dehydrogenase [Gordonia jinhuaensis]GGB33196.1 3-hydroxybutyryl-CoA dehydrogenase [Gordonia jinhuaensis]
MQKIGVIGGGTMGAGIAEVCIKAGSEVIIIEAKPEFVESAQKRVSTSLGKAVSRGKISQEDADAALARLTVTVDYDTLADRDLVIEAAPENLDLKRQIFARLDEVTSAEAILATNTSSIPVIQVATATKKPARVVGVHFFNPVPVMPLVEIISTLVTDEKIADTVADYVKNTLGKTVVRAGDQSGFIVNALLIPYLCQAIRMYASGYATAEDIDAAMVGGCGYPMGPLTLCDTVGLDIALAASESLYAEFGEPHLAPPPLLRRMVEAGQLGRKSGQGFYNYSK